LVGFLKGEIGNPNSPRLSGAETEFHRAEALPRSPLGKAVHYALGLWAQLRTYLEDGHIPIDHNATGNAIRPFVIGKKAWMFSDSPKGAQASAMMYTLVETAKANGLEPPDYSHVSAIFARHCCYNRT
jgi:hypothetical protein